MPIRYKLQFGWNSTSDHEWQYRKTLNKRERDEYDALDVVLQDLAVQTWLQTLDCK